MSRTEPQINIRIPSDLLKSLKAEAAREGRTMTAQVIYFIKKCLKAESKNDE